MLPQRQNRDIRISSAIFGYSEIIFFNVLKKNLSHKILLLGSIINHVRGQLGEGGLPNDHFITQALSSKSDHEGGGGDEKYTKF